VFQIPVVTFNNPNGLEGESGTVFSETPESGEAQLGEAGVGGAGSVAPGALEDSTVELSTEFTNMIETQRAYSASTRVVTTSDEMLQEIVNATR
jgi:flagellar hook protein FlgE